jgi:FlaG/FlaF family flagellin (archaellin)
MRGVSPLIASVLLIAISVLIAGILLSWGPSLVKDQTKMVSNKSDEVVSCVEITIDDVYMDFAANKSKVYVRAYGNTNIDDAQIQARNGDLARNLTHLPLAITRGDIGIIEFNLTNTTINSCANFSQAVISSSCLTDKYTAAPKNC